MAGHFLQKSHSLQGCFVENDLWRYGILCVFATMYYSAVSNCRLAAQFATFNDHAENWLESTLCNYYVCLLYAMTEGLNLEKCSHSILWESGYIYIRICRNVHLQLCICINLFTCEHYSFVNQHSTSIPQNKYIYHKIICTNVRTHIYIYIYIHIHICLYIFMVADV